MEWTREKLNEMIEHPQRLDEIIAGNLTTNDILQLLGLKLRGYGLHIRFYSDEQHVNLEFDESGEVASWDTYIEHV